MSNGKIHDLGGASVGFFILTAPLLVSVGKGAIEFEHFEFPYDWQKYTIVTGAMCIIGTLMLSPDLDVFPWRSVCQRRWDRIGIGFLNLGWIWEPYRRKISHRDELSHSILLGSIIRVLYLLAWSCCLLAWKPIREIDFIAIAVNHWGILLAAFVGIEISALVHYLLDGLIHRWGKKAVKKYVTNRRERLGHRKGSRRRARA